MAIFDNCHYKCIFSEIESIMLKVSKIEEDRTQSHAQGRLLHPPSALHGFLNYMYYTYLH